MAYLALYQVYDIASFAGGVACEDVALIGDTATESGCGINHVACFTPGPFACLVAGLGGVSVAIVSEV